jgi:hypothetical protein
MGRDACHERDLTTEMGRDTCPAPDLVKSSNLLSGIALSFTTRQIFLLSRGFPIEDNGDWGDSGLCRDSIDEEASVGRDRILLLGGA